MSARTKQLMDVIRKKDQDFSFLNKYIAKIGDISYSFSGFNCSLEPCFQFEKDDQVISYYFGQGGWETVGQNGYPTGYYNSLYFNKPKKYLAPEINHLVKIYNDHILEEEKYLSWKIFIDDRRKSREFKTVALCFGRVGVRLPYEMIFYILSFLRGWEFLFDLEIVDGNLTNFPKLIDIDQVIE